MHVWWFCAFEMQVITTLQCCVQLNLKNLRESAPMLKSSNNMDVINVMLRFLILMWHLHSTVSNKSGLHLYPLYCFISVFFFSLFCACFISSLKILNQLWLNIYGVLIKGFKISYLINIFNMTSLYQINMVCCLVAFYVVVF